MWSRTATMSAARGISSSGSAGLSWATRRRASTGGGSKASGRLRPKGTAEEEQIAGRQSSRRDFLTESRLGAGAVRELQPRVLREEVAHQSRAVKAAAGGPTPAVSGAARRQRAADHLIVLFSCNRKCRPLR